MTAKPTFSQVERLRTLGAVGTVPTAQADGSLLMAAGAGGGATDLQTAYSASLGNVPQVTLTSSFGPFTIRDNPTPIGDMFVLENSSGTDMFVVDPDTFSFGNAGRRTFEFSHQATSRGGIRFLPDGGTVTATPSPTYALQWDSVVTSSIPGGGGLGNDTAPALVGAVGSAVFADQGGLLSSALLFNQATRVIAQATVGPIYTMVNQPQIIGDGGVRTCSQHNALRIQTRWGPNINGGSITQTSAVYILNTATVDATVGSAAVTTLTYWQALNPTLTAGGTIGTFTGLDFVNISTPTTIRGIQSAMSNGTFINHVGTAPSNFAGDIFMNNGISLVLGTTGGNRVELLRSAVGTMRMIGQGGTNNEALEWDFDTAVADTIDVQSSTGAGLGFNLDAFQLGTSAADPTANHFFGISTPAKTITLGGDFANSLNSAGANHTIDAALSTFTQWTINAPAGTVGIGSVTNAANVLIQTAPSVGTNRYGLLITSNPSGGTLNYALRVSNGDVRFDGDLEHTGTNFGIFGTTPAAQPAAYTPTNVTTDRAYDANSTTLDEVADVLGTLIADLQSLGIVS